MMMDDHCPPPSKNTYPNTDARREYMRDYMKRRRAMQRLTKHARRETVERRVTESMANAQEDGAS